MRINQCQDSQNWDFLGVANAYYKNEVSLWFKTPDGKIVTIDGFFEEISNDFTLEDKIQYISVE